MNIDYALEVKTKHGLKNGDAFTLSIGCYGYEMRFIGSYIEKSPYNKNQWKKVTDEEASSILHMMEDKYCKVYKKKEELGSADFFGLHQAIGVPKNALELTVEEVVDNDVIQNEEEDMVNHPSHYCDGGIETADFIEAKKLDWHLGNALKYISRAGKKHKDKEIEDLEKAVWYIERKIKNLKAEKEGVTA